MGSDSSKLISDDLGSDDEDIDIENQSTNQIWNTFKKSPCSVDMIIFKKCIGNSMICSDIWHKYYEWYFEIVIHNFTSR